MNRFKWAVCAVLGIVALGVLGGAAPLAVAADEQEIVLRDGWQVQSSAKITGDGAQISTAGFDTKGWYGASMPRTVFAVLVDNGVYKDPYFGMNLRSVPGVEYAIGSEFSNQDMPANSPYAVPWWYRDEFEVPKHFAGKTIWIGFHGINYRAEIWINGKKVAGSDEAVGAFRRFRFDVTSFVQPGKKNVIAVGVSAPKAGELGITFVDWNPAPPDKDMGIWQEVVLRARGKVAVRYPFVETKLDLPGAAKAHLTIRAELQNVNDAPVKGVLKGKISGGVKGIEFSQPVELAAKETKEITITPEAVAALNVDNPKLWWPYQMGEPVLHKLTMEFKPDGGPSSDTVESNFGIVQMDSELTSDGYRLFKVNGKPVLVRGGGWTPDMMLRVNEARREAEFRYVKEMNMNAVRLEGKLEDDAFFERADRDGILVMAGWCCCDAWEKWNKWGDENRAVSVAALHDQLMRMRNHPSVLVWLNGSDNPPPPDRERAYLEVEKQVHWPKPVISSATAKKTDVTGESGVKMEGPYEFVSPNYWLTDTKHGGAWGFSTEISPGPAVPPLESLKEFIPEDKLWPINEVWNYHAGGGVFKDIHVYTNALEGRYGAAHDVADYAWKSQAVTYEGQRAMFEGYGRNKYKATGVIQWMLNNSWPGIIWHQYDYFLRPGGGFYGAKHAMELVHAQFSYDDRSIAIVNGMQQAQNGLKLTAKMYDLSMKELFSKEASVDVGADAVAKSFAVPEPTTSDATYFLNLELRSASGAIVSQNFYWLSTKPDVLNFAKSDWYYTPITSYADLTGLQKLPKVQVKASFKEHDMGGQETGGRVTLENPSKDLAFLVRLRLLKGANGPEILPVYWDDNYISLLPGEKREVDVRVRKSDAGSEKPVLAVDGFNVTPATIH
jgi:exo-1,4-beta-D-glucosaminidase